jgi:hypothetical protein
VNPSTLAADLARPGMSARPYDPASPGTRARDRGRGYREAMTASGEEDPFERFDAVLIEELRFACERGRALAAAESGLPIREVPALRETARGLEAVTREEVSWRLVKVMAHGDWPRLAEVAKRLADDPDVELDIGYTFDTPQRPLALWDDLIGPMFERYGSRQPDLEWQPELAREIVADWRNWHRSDHIRRQTLAPLHNIEVMLPLVEIGSDTTIRRMTHEEREEIWRHFGGLHIPGLTPGRRSAWKPPLITSSTW